MKFHVVAPTLSPTRSLTLAQILGQEWFFVLGRNWESSLRGAATLFSETFFLQVFPPTL